MRLKCFRTRIKWNEREKQPYQVLTLLVQFLCLHFCSLCIFRFFKLHYLVQRSKSLSKHMFYMYYIFLSIVSWFGNFTKTYFNVIWSECFDLNFVRSKNFFYVVGNVVFAFGNTTTTALQHLKPQQRQQQHNMQQHKLE